METKVRDPSLNTLCFSVCVCVCACVCSHRPRGTAAPFRVVLLPPFPPALPRIPTRVASTHRAQKDGRFSA